MIIFSLFFHIYNITVRSSQAVLLQRHSPPPFRPKAPCNCWNASCKDRGLSGACPGASNAQMDDKPPAPVLRKQILGMNSGSAMHWNHLISRWPSPGDGGPLTLHGCTVMRREGRLRCPNHPAKFDGFLKEGWWQPSKGACKKHPNFAMTRRRSSLAMVAPPVGWQVVSWCLLRQAAGSVWSDGKIFCLLGLFWSTTIGNPFRARAWNWDLVPPHVYKWQAI